MARLAIVEIAEVAGVLPLVKGRWWPILSPKNWDTGEHSSSESSPDSSSFPVPSLKELEISLMLTLDWLRSRSSKPSSSSPYATQSVALLVGDPADDDDAYLLRALCVRESGDNAPFLCRPSKESHMLDASEEESEPDSLDDSSISCVSKGPISTTCERGCV